MALAQTTITPSARNGILFPSGRKALLIEAGTISRFAARNDFYPTSLA